jgi:hypothetical protein
MGEDREQMACEILESSHQALRDGVVANYAELARLGHVNRARMTQIMSLLQLAPDIQDELLFLPPVTSGKDPITERDLRPIVAELDWREQRRMWGLLQPRSFAIP